ncbi:MAG TPA: T9SS type A sorting domain-containing protein [Bacteroidota bacterium]|nr:T9SS type A sorting domain-containing protein [Bacteroidota bacterium]
MKAWLTGIGYKLKRDKEAGGEHRSPIQSYSGGGSMQQLSRVLAIVLVVCCMVIGSGVAGEKQSVARHTIPTVDMQTQPARELSTEERSIISQLLQARRGDNVAAARSLEERLMQLRGISSDVDTRASGDGPEFVAGAPPFVGPDRWGNDIMVYSGNILGLSLRRIATEVDANGTIYVEGIVNTTGTDVLRSYKSTDNGLTWTYFGGVQFTGRNIQSFAFHVTDTTGAQLLGHLISFSLPSSRQDGDLYWVSYHDDASIFRAVLVKAGSGGLGYSNPALVSDGFDYSPALTYWFGAAALVDSNGVSNGIIAFRSTNNGQTWPIVDTVRTGFDYRFPSIDYESVGTDEEVYVASQINFLSGGRNTSDIRLRKQTAFFGGTPQWPQTTVTADTLDDFDPDISVGRTDADVIVTFTMNYQNSGDLDIQYSYSNDSGATMSAPLNVAASSRDEYFSSSNIYQTTSTSFFRVAYVDVDSVMYKGTGTITGLGAAARTRVNEFTPTGTARPEIGSHGIGAGSNGHVIYAGFGPTNIYYDGFDIFVAVDEDPAGVPTRSSLEQNYPNPFNPSTEIRYTIGEPGQVSLKIYNLLGQEVASLVNERQLAGAYKVRLDGGSLASGMYFYRLQANGFVESRKMLLLK